MERKGQAAMEFLMTYGWAILAAIIAIAVLAYFGVFSPGKYVPESCILNAPWGCGEETKVTNGATADVASLMLSNGGADSYTIDSVIISGCVTDAVPTGNVYAVGENKAISITCADFTTAPITKADIGAAGARFKGDITKKYHKTATGDAGDLQATGSMIKIIRA